MQESSVRGSNTSVGPTEALPRKAYKGRVRAYTSGGFTLWSEWVTSNVCRSFPSPDMPGGIECTAITENLITFRWDSVLGTEGYRYGAVIRGTVDVDRLEATDGDDHPNPSAPASGVSLDLGVDRQYGVVGVGLQRQRPQRHGLCGLRHHQATPGSRRTDRTPFFGPSDLSTFFRSWYVRVVVLLAGRCGDAVCVFVGVPGNGAGPDPGWPVGGRFGP